MAVIWVLVFSVTVNIGTDAAVIGMCFHSIAYLVKVFSESFEQINRDTIDALRACGAVRYDLFGSALQAHLTTQVRDIVYLNYYDADENNQLIVP